MKSKKKSAAEESAAETFPLVAGIFRELSGKISENPFFAFWEYLAKASDASKSLKKSIAGKICKNVFTEGNLVLGVDSIILPGTRIEGNVFIGKNCKIGPNAYIRGNTLIADECHIGMCEVKNSIILKGSNVPHFSYVGDSVIGENVNLGAGTNLANLRFDDKNVKVELNGEKLDSGRRKLGALIGSNTKIGINCSINCGIIIGNNCRIFPSRAVEKNLANNETLKSTTLG